MISRSIEDVEYAIGPVTQRTAHVLAPYYGYQTAHELAESMPAGAQVLDIGAGLSEFGHYIAARRPDIEWTNFDIRYLDDFDLRNQRDLKRYKDSLPDNLSLVGEDVSQINDIFPARYFDRVFSYFMLRHVFDRDFPKGCQTVHNILGLAKEGAKVSIGPVRGRMAARVMLSREGGLIDFNGAPQYGTLASAITIESPSTERGIRKLTSLITSTIR